MPGGLIIYEFRFNLRGEGRDYYQVWQLYTYNVRLVRHNELSISGFVMSSHLSRMVAKFTQDGGFVSSSRSSFQLLTWGQEGAVLSGY
jgi:hypothetical protein